MKYQWSITIPFDSQGQFEDQMRGLVNNGDLVYVATVYVLKTEMTTITAKCLSKPFRSLYTNPFSLSSVMSNLHK